VPNSVGGSQGKNNPDEPCRRSPPLMAEGPRLRAAKEEWKRRVLGREESRWRKLWEIKELEDTKGWKSGRGKFPHLELVGNKHH